MLTNRDGFFLTTDIIAPLQLDASVGGLDVVEEFLGVFADERLLVVTSNVVPRNSVVVNVVQNTQAGFVGAIDVEFGIVGLSLLLVTGLTPWIVSPAGWDLKLFKLVSFILSTLDQFIECNRKNNNIDEKC